MKLRSALHVVASNKTSTLQPAIASRCGVHCLMGHVKRFHKFYWAQLFCDMCAGAELGPAYLFFGCRKKSQDYIYEQELAMYSRSGVLQKLCVAFSRDAANKVYVQHEMQQQAAEIADVLSDQQGGHLYVCGDAKRMAKDVHAALNEILQTVSGLSSNDAEAKLKAWTDSSRYQRDVW